MRKTLYSLLAVAALLLQPALASAQSADLTVADEGVTNNYIPVYGYYTDAAQHNQIVYPSDMLEDMFSGSITSMTFYMSEVAAADWGITATVSIATTTADDASSLDETTTLTQVWQGPWSGLLSEFTIVFDEPFVYDGGNLLVDIVTTTGTWKQAYFYGATVTNGSICTYDSWGTNTNVQNFVPKTKFGYTVGSATVCRKPQNIVFTNYTNQGVTVSWTAPIDGPSDYAVLIDGEVVATATDTFAVLNGLDANTQYTVKVKHVCGDGDSSSALTGTFKTLCQNGNCEMTIQCSGDYSWSSPSVLVYQKGSELASINGTQSVEVCNDDSVIVILNAVGSYNPRVTVIDGGESELVSNWSTSGHSTGDTVVVIPDPCPSCMPVNAVYYIATSSYSATIHWTDNNSLGIGNYVVTVNGSVDYVYNDTTYTFATDPMTHYDVTVARLCEDDDISFARPVSFNSPCDDNAYAPLPFHTSFEELDPTSDHHTDIMPDCWVAVQQGTNPDPSVNGLFPSAYRWQYNAHTGSVYFEFESTSGQPEVLALPRMENVSTLQLSFYAAAVNNNFMLEAGVVELDDNNEYVFVPIDTIQLITANSWGTDSYHVYNVLFDTYEGNGERLALRTTLTGSGTYTLMIDDFSVIYAGAPVLGPFNPATHTVNVDTNLVLAANLMSGEGVSYTWESQMVNAGNANIVSQDSNTVTIHYSVGGIDSVSVIASTGFGDDDTAYVTVSVIDNTPINEFPYNNSFEEGDDLSWRTNNSSNGWYIGTATAQEGTHSLYISDMNGSNNSYGANTGSAYAYRAIAFAEAGEYAINFAWHCQGNSSNYMRVYLAVGNVTPSGTYGYTAVSDALYGHSDWQQFEGVLDVDTGLYTLIFYWSNNSTINNPAAAVDDISIERLTCSSVGNLEAHNVYAHGADIVWSPRSEETEWWIEVDNADGYAVQEDSVHIDGFDGLTTHTVRVRAICGDGDTSAVRTVTFTTTVPCPPVSNITISDITTEGATIGWTAGGTESAWRLVIGNGDTIDVADTTYTATGLDANTAYNVTVLANCGDEDGTSTPASKSFRTLCEGGSCVFTVEMHDNYGDGWNGSAINVYQNNELFESVTLATGNAETLTVSPCLGEPIALVWHSGLYTYEASFIIKNADDSVLVSLGADDPSEGDTLVVFDGSCNATVYDINEPIIPGTCPDPTALTTTATETTVDFSFSGNATDYDVEIVEGSYTAYTWPGFTENAVRINTTSHTFEGLEPGTTYTVAVRAVCDEDEGEYSDVVVITVTTEEHLVENCDAPVDVDVPEATIDSTYAVVHWTEAGSATTWQISLKRGADEQLFTTSNNPYTVSGLTPGATYYVKVRALCSATDTSAWSQSAVFQAHHGSAPVDTTGIATVDEIAVSLYPNPASDYATLEVAEPAEVVLVDLNGREVYAARTEGTLRIELARLSRGTYFVRIVGQSGIALRKLVVR